MSGAADDEPAPSTGTPQSPEGGDGEPDVTVAETKPDTPITPADDSATQSEPQNDNTDSNADNKADEESKTEGDESKTDVGDGAKNVAKDSHPGGDGEKSEAPFPETGESEPTEASDAVNENTADGATEEETKRAESGSGETEESGETGEAKEPNVEKDEGADDRNNNESAKEEVKEEDQAAETAEASPEEHGKNANDSVPLGDETTPAENRDDADKGVTEVVNKTPAEQSEVGSEDAEAQGSEELGTDAQQESIPDAASNKDAKDEVTPAESAVDNQEATNVENRDSGISADITPQTDNVNDAPPVVAAENSERIEKNVGVSELDSLKAENESLRKKVKEVEEELERIREGRKEGMKIQADYLARELSQQQDTEKYLREKLAEVLQEKEESERRVKDLQLRMKRFAKDDQAKDARMAKMEKELSDISQEVQTLENMLDEETLRRVQEQRASGKMNGPKGEGAGGQTSIYKGNKAAHQQPPPPQSKTCVIL